MQSVSQPRSTTNLVHEHSANSLRPMIDTRVRHGEADEASSCECSPSRDNVFVVLAEGSASDSVAQGLDFKLHILSAMISINV